MNLSNALSCAYINLKRMVEVWLVSTTRNETSYLEYGSCGEDYEE